MSPQEWAAGVGDVYRPSSLTPAISQALPYRNDLKVP